MFGYYLDLLVSSHTLRLRRRSFSESGLSPQAAQGRERQFRVGQRSDRRQRTQFGHNRPVARRPQFAR